MSICQESRNVRLSGRQKILSKKVKKGVDKRCCICYTNTCRRERVQNTPDGGRNLKTIQRETEKEQSDF